MYTGTSDTLTCSVWRLTSFAFTVPGDDVRLRYRETGLRCGGYPTESGYWWCSPGEGPRCPEVTVPWGWNY